MTFSARDHAGASRGPAAPGPTRSALGLVCALGAACCAAACADQHHAATRADASTLPPHDSAIAEVEDASDADVALDTGAARSPDAGSTLACRLCIDRTETPRLYVLNAGELTCTVLHLVRDSSCAGFNIGAGDYCLQAATLWPASNTCPPADAGAPFMAHSAQGSVVGHEGVLHIKVQLDFSAEAPRQDVAVDFKACGPDYELLRPPCP